MPTDYSSFEGEGRFSSVALEHGRHDSHRHSGEVIGGVIDASITPVDQGEIVNTTIDQDVGCLDVTVNEALFLTVEMSTERRQPIGEPVVVPRADLTVGQAGIQQILGPGHRQGRVQAQCGRDLQVMEPAQVPAQLSPWPW